MCLSFFLENNIDRTVDIVTAEFLSPYLEPYVLEEVEYFAL